ncbi:DUF6207 family protein [Streptomyces sp. NPDC005728]
MDPINEAHVSEPGLLVVDVAAADDATATHILGTAERPQEADI